MLNVTEFPARGKIIEVSGETVVFHPTGTSYQIHLTARGEPVAAGSAPVQGVIRVRARKLWTVNSGGLFVSPIFGSPRTIQGRVRSLNDRQLILSAGTNIVIDIPGPEAAVDLAAGAITVGSMVNVATLPGGTFELLIPAASP